MIFPALDAVTEHVYINIGPPLGTGSGNSRVNAKGVTSINNYFYLERNYNLVTNKKHRVVHVVGLDSIKDNRTGDAGVPSTMVNADYFYDVYYEVDGVYGSFGCALPFVRIFNLHATTITHGSSAAYSKQYYINPKVETTFANPSYAMLSVYMGGSIIARGQLHLINPLLVNTGTAFKIKRLTGVGNTNETYIYGGAIVGKGYTSTAPLIDYFSDNGEKLFIYNTAINIDNATTKIVEPTSGYVDGANIPEVRITNCTFKNASMNVDPKTTSTNNTFGVLPEDVFTNYETNNFLAPAGIYSNSGLDLTTLPVYGWADYENWNIGLREAEPLLGAIIVNSLTSILGSKTIRPGVSFTITLTGDIGDTPGTVILKNSLQTSQLSFTIDSWNNVTKEIVCTVPVSYNVRYNDSDALIFITRADGEPLSPYGGVTYLASVGVQTRLGELFSTAPGSIFNNAVTPPSGTYQIQWRDPDNTGAIILANGIIDSISTSGSIFVRIYDETDSSISDEVQIVLYIVAVTSGLTVRGLTVRGLTVSGLGVRGLSVRGLGGVAGGFPYLLPFPLS